MSCSIVRIYTQPNTLPTRRVRHSGEYRNTASQPKASTNLTLTTRRLCKTSEQRAQGQPKDMQRGRRNVRYPCLLAWVCRGGKWLLCRAERHDVAVRRSVSDCGWRIGGGGTNLCRSCRRCLGACFTRRNGGDMGILLRSCAELQSRLPWIVHHKSGQML